ncbi:MAG TPA: HAD family hydrolase [Desulfobacteraceae bacterium]|nr:HAD family hydrolase [Desulfobacteraceae bacterium]
MIKSVKAVGFDLFNTLITLDSTALVEAENRLTAELHAAGLTVEKGLFIDSHRKWARRFLEGTRKDGRETHNRFWIGAALADAGHEVDPEDPLVAAAVEAYFSSFVERCRLIPGTIDMLRGLSADYRLGLLSNFTHGPAAREILNTTGLAECFDIVVISGEMGYRKPHRMVFDRLVAELGVSPDETIYIGDDPEPDITGALGAGIRPVWTTYVVDRGLPYAPGYMSRESEEDFQIPRISSWDDLKDLLYGLEKH